MRRRIAPWILFGFMACGDAERPRYVTEHLVVELYDGEVLCAGTLATMDEQVERVAAFLGVPPPDEISVHYGPSAVKAGCGGTWNGCARASGVYANDDSIFHELIHAIRFSQGYGGGTGRWLFEEGFAEVFSGYRWDPYYVREQASTLERGPAVLAAFPRGEKKFVPDDYSTAGHFVSWLRLTYGDATLLAFLNDPRYLGGDGYEEAFAAHYGLSIAEADSAWRSTSAMDYLWSVPCDPAHALTWTGSTLEFSDTVDCQAPHTTGPAGAIDTATLRSRCFTLVQPDMMRVEFDAGGGRIRLMPVDCVESDGLAPESCDYKELKGGEADELPLGAGTWEVQVDSVASLTLAFTLRLTPL